MKRLREMCGMPVVEEKSGKRIGKIERVLLRAGEERLRGLEIRRRGWGASRLFCEMEDVRCFGEVSVIVRSVGAVPPARQVFDLIGHRVYAEGDRLLGWATDAILEEESVTSIEVSRGYIDDWAEGRRWMSEFTMGPRGVVATLRVTDEEIDSEGR